MAGTRRSARRLGAAGKPGAARRTLAILSRNPKLYSTRRLVAAARAAGLRTLLLDTLRCELLIGGEHPALLHRGEPLDPDRLLVAIPRIGASVTGYGLSVVSQLELLGVPALNGAEAIARSRDKLRALQLLSRDGIPIPRTVQCRSRDEVPAAVERVGGLPCIIKLTRGTHGIGVMIASTTAEVTGLLDTLWTLGQEIILQELVAESRGRDVRALVVGGEVVAAMRRTARAGEFRSNIHRGGEATQITLPEPHAAVAVRAAAILGLGLAGVDLLEASDGPRIMEVNSSPGLEGLERATGRDLAGQVVSHAIAHGELARAR